MSIKVVAYSFLLALLVSVGLPLATAEPAVGTDGIEINLEEEQIEIDEETENVHVDGVVSTGSLGVAVRGPSCELRNHADAQDLHCESARVDVTRSSPSVGVDVRVNLPVEEPVVEQEEAAVETSTITIELREHVPGVVLASAVAGVSALGAYGVWRGFRFLAFAGFIPLYSHIRDEDLLNDPNRARIFTLIREEPGASTKDVADRLALAWGTVTHHLTKLEKRRMIVSKKYGKYRRYFVNGAVPGAGGKDALAVLRVEKTAEIASFIRENPGLSQKEVSAAIGVSPSTVLWHVKRLVRADLVDKARDGKHVKYYATPLLDEATHRHAVTPRALTTPVPS